MMKVPNPMSISTVNAEKKLGTDVSEEVLQAPRTSRKATEACESRLVPQVRKTDEKISVSSFIARVRAIKHIEIYAAVVVIAIMVLVFFSSIGGSGKPASAQVSSTPLTNVEQNYVREMEQKLVSVLSQVRGAGSVSVMVTAVGSSTLEIAYNIDEKTITQNGGSNSSTSTSTVTKTPVMVGGNPFVLTETKPQLKGVLVVASGANNPAVRLDLLRALQTLIADNSVIIEVLAA